MALTPTAIPPPTTKRRPSSVRLAQPVLIERPNQRMAVVHTRGDPQLVAEPAFKALYGAVYALKYALRQQGIVYSIAPVRARWPDAHLLPKDEWAAFWAIPVPADTVALVQKHPDLVVRLEDWEYGTCAEILHRGAYDDEIESIQRLHAFVAERGYVLAGDHEEEYLTSPHAKHRRTLIRYVVRLR